MAEFTLTRLRNMKVCVIDVHLGLTVCPLNVHKIRAEKRYLTNLRNSYKVFRYLYIKFALTDEYKLHMYVRSFSLLHSYEQSSYARG